MSKKIDVTLGTRAEVELMESTGGTLVNEERFKCERGNRLFAVGDRLELHSLQEYPELNGEVVTVTAYRESRPDQNGYYIKSESGRVEKWLNFVWEGRLRRCELVQENAPDTIETLQAEVERLKAEIHRLQAIGRTKRQSLDTTE